MRRDDGEGPLGDLIDAVEDVVAWLRSEASPDDRLAGSYPLLTMLSVAVAGWLMKRQSREAERRLADGEGDPAFLAMKRAAAAFFDTIVEEAIGLAGQVRRGAGLLYSVPKEAFSA